MIKNINYLKTAIEVLEDGTQTPDMEIKILKTMAQICQQNINRLEIQESLKDLDHE